MNGLSYCKAVLTSSFFCLKIEQPLDFSAHILFFYFPYPRRLHYELCPPFG